MYPGGRTKMTTLLSVSIAILAGLIMTRLVKPLKLPDVTAYLLAGVFVGPYCLGAIGIEGLGFTSNEAVTSLSLISEAALGFIAFSIGPVEIGFSSLLVCMMLGTTFCNLCPLSTDLIEKSDRWTSPLFALFFVISGAELELSVFADVAIVGIGVVYIIFRSLGKIFGAYISTRWTKCPPQVCKYLGITLLPQAGVALGMCITARQLGAEGDLIRNIILFSVLIYELFGPMLTKYALTKAGDIHPMSDEVKNRREIKLSKLQQSKER